MDPTPKTESNPDPIPEVCCNQHTQLVISETGPDGQEQVLMSRRQVRGPLA